MMNFKEFYTKGITHHLKERKRLDSQILIFVLHSIKNGKYKVSPIITYDHSPMDHAQEVIDSLQPDMYLICAETWMHSPKNRKEFEDNYKWGDLNKSQNKFEGIAFIAKTMDGKEEHSEMYRIFRKDGKIVSYQNMEMKKMTSEKLT